MRHLYLVVHYHFSSNKFARFLVSVPSAIPEEERNKAKADTDPGHGWNPERVEYICPTPNHVNQEI